MADKIINAVALVAIMTIAVGILLAIWFGLIGLKIAASGLVIFVADWILCWWIQEERRQND